MKIKLFANTTISVLEKEVNEFLETVENVIDIKYSSNETFTEILVIYDEIKAAE